MIHSIKLVPPFSLSANLDPQQTQVSEPAEYCVGRSNLSNLENKLCSIFVSTSPVLLHPHCSFFFQIVQNTLPMSGSNFSSFQKKRNSYRSAGCEQGEIAFKSDIIISSSPFQHIPSIPSFNLSAPSVPSLLPVSSVLSVSPIH